MSNKIFAANWKLNKTPEESRQFVINFKNLIFKNDSFFNSREVILFPQAYSLEALQSLCSGSKINYGPQNVYSEVSGAFTGENSAEVAAKMGSKFALVGHSERRTLFAEVNEQLNKKNQLLQKIGLTPVYCIGETLQQREANQTLDICMQQLSIGLKDLDLQKRIVIAYEPVWAIGTGKVASIEQVAEVHAEICKYMQKLGFKDFQILYGGSVKPENSKELQAVSHVDGFLIGGAALNVDSFIKICEA